MTYIPSLPFSVVLILASFFSGFSSGLVGAGAGIFLIMVWRISENLLGVDMGDGDIAESSRRLLAISSILSLSQYPFSLIEIYRAPQKAYRLDLFCYTFFGINVLTWVGAYVSTAVSAEGLLIALGLSLMAIAVWQFTHQSILNRAVDDQLVTKKEEESLLLDLQAETTGNIDLIMCQLEHGQQTQGLLDHNSNSTEHAHSNGGQRSKSKGGKKGSKSHVRTTHALDDIDDVDDDSACTRADSTLLAIGTPEGGIPSSSSYDDGNGPSFNETNNINGISRAEGSDIVRRKGRGGNQPGDEDSLPPVTSLVSERFLASHGVWVGKTYPTPSNATGMGANRMNANGQVARAVNSSQDGSNFASPSFRSTTSRPQIVIQGDGQANFSAHGRNNTNSNITSNPSPPHANINTNITVSYSCPSSASSSATTSPVAGSYHAQVDHSPTLSTFHEGDEDDHHAGTAVQGSTDKGRNRKYGRNGQSGQNGTQNDHNTLPNHNHNVEYIFAHSPHARPTSPYPTQTTTTTTPPHTYPLQPVSASTTPTSSLSDPHAPQTPPESPPSPQLTLKQQLAPAHIIAAVKQTFTTDLASLSIGFTMGCVSGLLGGLWGINTPPLSLYFTYLGLTGTTIRDTLLLIYFANLPCLLASRIIFSIYRPEEWLIYLVSAPITIIGLKLGFILHSKVPNQRFILSLLQVAILLSGLPLLKPLGISPNVTVKSVLTLCAYLTCFALLAVFVVWRKKRNKRLRNAVNLTFQHHLEHAVQEQQRLVQMLGPVAVGEAGEVLEHQESRAGEVGFESSQNVAKSPDGPHLIQYIPRSVESAGHSSSSIQNTMEHTVSFVSRVPMAGGSTVSVQDGSISAQVGKKDRFDHLDGVSDEKSADWDMHPRPTDHIHVAIDGPDHTGGPQFTTEIPITPPHRSRLFDPDSARPSLQPTQTSAQNAVVPPTSPAHPTELTTTISNLHSIPLAVAAQYITTLHQSTSEAQLLSLKPFTTVTSRPILLHDSSSITKYDLMGNNDNNRGLYRRKNAKLTPKHHSARLGPHSATNRALFKSTTTSQNANSGELDPESLYASQETPYDRDLSEGAQDLHRYSNYGAGGQNDGLQHSISMILQSSSTKLNSLLLQHYGRGQRKGGEYLGAAYGQSGESGPRVQIGGGDTDKGLQNDDDWSKNGQDGPYLETTVSDLSALPPPQWPQGGSYLVGSPSTLTTDPNSPASSSQHTHSHASFRTGLRHANSSAAPTGSTSAVGHSNLNIAGVPLGLDATITTTATTSSPNNNSNNSKTVHNPPRLTNHYSTNSTASPYIGLTPTHSAHSVSTGSQSSSGATTPSTSFGQGQNKLPFAHLITILPVQPPNGSPRVNRTNGTHVSAKPPTSSPTQHNNTNGTNNDNPNTFVKAPNLPPLVSSPNNRNSNRSNNHSMNSSNNSNNASANNNSANNGSGEMQLQPLYVLPGSSSASSASSASAHSPSSAQSGQGIQNSSPNVPNSPQNRQNSSQDALLPLGTSLSNLTNLSTGARDGILLGASSPTHATGPRGSRRHNNPGPGGSNNSSNNASNSASNNASNNTSNTSLNSGPSGNAIISTNNLSGADGSAHPPPSPLPALPLPTIFSPDNISQLTSTSQSASTQDHLDPSHPPPQAYPPHPTTTTTFHYSFDPANNLQSPTLDTFRHPQGPHYAVAASHALQTIGADGATTSDSSTPFDSFLTSPLHPSLHVQFAPQGAPLHNQTPLPTVAMHTDSLPATTSTADPTTTATNSLPPSASFLFSPMAVHSLSRHSNTNHHSEHLPNLTPSLAALADATTRPDDASVDNRESIHNPPNSNGDQDGLFSPIQEPRRFVVSRRPSKQDDQDE